mmetsp:Transcript_18718/g.28426  ORF Transcript_18718/g.28426 Transcript_18718/m.28426 type:complete len:329 (-) Transcript_18718:1790-2776(-)|eukprot:CAMPEP_0194089650 /NCGR_PEP_ID=MMETSP0149-20130528/35422_1 /TAXON_ID=122233 /ORGANISM="Chaetoceros debilis, Strain MM31A-1" /LENGTH=328 /DNA_ID=CAMNT_0038773657 /DNA_START=296 /DNA_END=1282 /DNA_ORIENTATION=+
MSSLAMDSEDRPADGSIEKKTGPSITAAVAEKTRPQLTSSRSTSSKSKAIIPPTKKDMRKIFVGGIGKGVTNDNFYDFFCKFGKVIDSVVMFDRETKKPRGFGFVTFEDAKVALHLLAMGHEKGENVPEGGFTSGKIKVYGRLCEVKASEPKRCVTKNNFSGTSNSTASSPLEGRVPKKIQFQNGEVGATSKYGAIDGSSANMSNGRENSPAYQYGYATSVMQEPPRAEYGFGYGAHNGYGYSQYHANPTFHYSPQPAVPVGYNPAFDGIYYNPVMLHHYPYPYYSPVPPQGSGNFYPPDGYSMGHYPGNSDGGTESEMNAPTSSQTS